MKNFLFTLLILLPQSVNAWVWVGNGGDAIRCQSSNNNPFKGYYSLDYILTYDRLSPAMEPRAIANLQDSLLQIQKVLSAASPSMALDLQIFAKHLWNQTDSSAPYRWEPASWGLVDISDEELMGLQLPNNCLEQGKPQKIQAILRQTPQLSGLPISKTLFRFVPEVVEQLKIGSSVQLSYLIIHEFLWNYSNHVQTNRRVNRYLHSKQILNDNTATIREKLSNLGFQMPMIDQQFFEVCQGKPANQLEVQDISRQINNRERRLQIDFNQQNRLCTRANGCFSEWLLSESNGLSANINRIVGVNNAQGLSQLYLSFDQQNTVLLCDFKAQGQNLTNCRLTGSIPKAWWAIGNNHTYKWQGQLDRQGRLCLRSETYQPINFDWLQIEALLIGQ